MHRLTDMTHAIYRTQQRHAGVTHLSGAGKGDDVGVCLGGEVGSESPTSRQHDSLRLFFCLRLKYP